MMPSLRARLQQSNTLLAPGSYDALSALLIEEAGFEATYISGASIAYTQLGRPDIGLVSLDHLADVVSRIRDRISLPIIVDGDTGFGNALNTQRTIRLLERNGANAIQIEDQEFPKRCGHLDGKRLIPAQEMAGKLKAALDARRSDETLIIARTDAIAVESFEHAIERAHLYKQCGVDLLFIEAPQSMEQLQRIADEFGNSVPLLANMVEGGQTPILSASELSTIGFKLVISPGALVRSLIPRAEEFLHSLRQNGSTVPFRPYMTDLDGVNQRIGLSSMLQQAKLYDGTSAE